jgi:uncharacterized protein
MLNRIFKLGLSVMMFGCLAVLHAQQASPNRAQKISPEKQALIKKLLDATNSKKNAEEIFKSQFDELVKQMPEIVWQTISEMTELKQLAPKQQQEMRAKMSESAARISTRMRELFLQRIDIGQLIEEISYRVYDKYFTDSELKDLVDFNESATGKKVIEVMPKLVAESTAKVTEVIMPKVKGIMSEIQVDETRQISKEIQLLSKSEQGSTKPSSRPQRRHRGHR